MSKLLMMFSALFLLVLFPLAQENQTPPKAPPPAEYTIPVDATRQANPVKPTPESIARGKKLYGFDCAMCHGASGDGKGDLATDMKLKIADFSDATALKDRTDGELFYVIKNGKGQMPPEGDRVKADAIWDTVNYVRSLAKKKAPEEKAATPPGPAS
jgi:mono/diheme cytochrome c family protein